MYFPVKCYKETANAFHLRLASDDLWLSKQEYDSAMGLKSDISIFRHGCATCKLLLPSPTKQVELVNIVREDKLAHSVEGKTKTVLNWQIRVNKAKQDLKTKSLAAKRTSLHSDETKEETARIKVIQAQEDLLHTEHEKNLSMSASEGLFAVESCTSTLHLSVKRVNNTPKPTLNPTNTHTNLN
ncbi:uncharacterized protein ARMOST_20350 [Armillaria ostoyae]|uniref:Uncharacterized protein n=1 Tax=Armillaria ostoyae TaxID=47428 RepID=A0A284S741_ARMOS|nr:uncharacterized protein ARMOST_20350 [Armillaria ostoyae]